MNGFACLLPMMVFVVTAEYLGVPLPNQYFTWIRTFAQHVNEDSLFMDAAGLLM